MRIVERFILTLVFCVMVFFNRSLPVESAQPDEIHNFSLLVAENRFVDNGDGTVTDTERHLMWQKGDSEKELTFGEALEYCASLRLGGHTGWRLPMPEEQETAVVKELMMPRHARDVHDQFDLYWSLDPEVLLPFNYRPSHGREILRAYPAKQGDRAFVRAVRSLGSG
ncbi:MAG TPA: DUF1566 domain-containing protein [Syntrophales bacterium]|nr:DUF1566 domain-containing protein [Syntrophales bacterium]